MADGDEEISSFWIEKHITSTQRATRGSQAIFEAYLQAENIAFPTTAEELARVLCTFYAEVRTKNGKMYAKSSLCTLRFALNRHFKQVLNVDIIKDKEFIEANRVYETQCAELRERGLGTTEHKPPISDEDIKKLYRSGLFATDTPTTLQNKVFFEIMLFFCRHGRQNLRQLRKDDFEIKVNSQGDRYVVKITDDYTGFDTGEDGRVMVANDGPFCPVYSFEKYLSHLNPFNESLFQRPKLSLTPNDGQIWYENMAVGEHRLGKKMKVLSQQANLSKTYTNYSIRATTITILDRCGFEPRRIMSMSGHRTVSSIKSHSKTNRRCMHEPRALLKT